MPLAQKPPYCGKYFCGAASNSALCSALAKRKVTPSYTLLICAEPRAWRPSVKYATTSWPLSMTRASSPSATAFTGLSAEAGFCAVMAEQPASAAAAISKAVSSVRGFMG